MERQVKERLIGAAVLVAAAVILIPEMLSGSGSGTTENNAPVAATTGDAPLKTYTIDLSKSPTTVPDADVKTLTTAAPPPEVSPTDTVAAEATQAIPESSAGEPQSEADAPVPQETAPVPAQPTPAVVKPPAPEPATIKSSEGAWAVQLGSFSNHGTADGMAGKLKAEGFDAFVMPVKSGANTLYRVRIGPFSEREAAASALSKVKAKVPAATVVKHP